MEVISSAPQKRHVAWKGLHNSLVTDLENGVTPTRRSLTANLETSLNEEDGTWLKVQFLNEKNNEILATNLAACDMNEIMDAIYNLIGLEIRRTRCPVYGLRRHRLRFANPPCAEAENKTTT
ncbi:hypothetical protein V8C40DRAFT_264516 [Trichoderma camerunense]